MGTRKLRKVILFFVLTVMTGILVGLTRSLGASVMALPPPEDIPEEILRTEIITEARSPIDGKPLTAAEYAELQAHLQTSPTPKLDPRIRQNIFMLRVLKSFRLLFPFLKF